MLLLAMDTATEKGSLALAEDGRVLAATFLETPGAYLTRLLPAVEELLQGIGRRPADLGGLAVSQGPGNFTGLRIGLATAKGLAWALNRPLAAVPTLEAIAAQVPRQPQPIAVLMDAKREEVYLGLFLLSPLHPGGERVRVRGGAGKSLGSEYICPVGIPQPLAAPVRLPVAALPARLAPPLVVTGPGLDAYQDFLAPKLSPGIAWAPPEVRYPQAATIARLGAHRLEQGLAVAPQQLTPAYLRPAL